MWKRCCPQIQGVVERNGQKLAKPTISGKWDGSLTAELDSGEQLQLWERNPPPPDPTRWPTCGTTVPAMIWPPSNHRCCRRPCDHHHAHSLAMQASVRALNTRCQISARALSARVAFLWEQESLREHRRCLFGSPGSGRWQATQVQPHGVGHQAERDHARAGP